MTTPELEPWVEALRADLPTDRDRERMRARLRAAGVAVGVGVGVAQAAAPAAAAASTGGAAVGGAAGAGTPLATSVTAKLLATAWTTKLAVAVIGVAVGGAPFVLPRLRSESSVKPPAVHVAPRSAASAPHGSIEVAPREAERSAGMQPVPEALVPLPAGAPPQPALPAPAANASASNLAQEARLIASALRALGRDDAPAARRFLDTHGRRFPEGSLAPERRRLAQRLPAGDLELRPQTEGKDHD